MTSFWRLKEVEASIDGDGDESSQHPIFSFQVSLGGSRKFIALTKEKLWSFYEQLDPRYYYEVIRPHNRSKIYYDLEFESTCNKNKNGHDMVNLLIDLTNKKLLKDFGHFSEASDVLILESHFKNKFSCHLIFLRTAFKNNLEVGGFVKDLVSSLSPADRDVFLIEHNGKKQLFVDLSVYRHNQQFRDAFIKKTVIFSDIVQKGGRGSGSNYYYYLL